MIKQKIKLRFRYGIEQQWKSGRIKWSVIWLLAGIALASMPFTSTMAATNLVQDSFSRSISGGWGDAPTGGTYAVSSSAEVVGTAASFAVKNDIGSVVVRTPGDTAVAYLPGVSARDIDMRVKVKASKLAVGGPEYVSLLARQIGANSMYRGQFGLRPDGTLRFRAFSIVNGAQTALSSPIVANGIQLSAGSVIQIRMAVSGVNPTVIRLKAWPDGQPEPSTWPYRVTDSTGALQVAGNVGLSAGLSETISNVPVTFAFDDLSASSGDTQTAAAQSTPVSVSGVQATVTPYNVLPGSSPTPAPPTVAPTEVTCVCLAMDSFNRTVADSWGSATTGGAYTLSGTAANFDVDGAAGVMSLSLPNAYRSAYLTNVVALNVDATFRVKQDKVAQGGGQLAYFVARRQGEGTEYEGRLRFGTDGKIYLQAAQSIAGSVTLLGSEVYSSWAQAANRYVRVRVQVFGSNPTTIRIKLWSDGAAEPTAWQYSATDSTPGLQDAGGIGLRTYLGSAATNAPVTITFDDLLVNDASRFIPTPTSPASTPVATRPAATPTPTRVNVTQPTPTAIPTGSSASGSIYWGANIDGQQYGYSDPPWDWRPVDIFESNAQKKISILHYGQPWVMNGVFQKFQPNAANTVRSHGAIPLIDWSSWHLGYGVKQPDFQNSDIYQGNYDDFIRQWATDAKNWGHPFFLRLDWEMNGWWSFSWVEGKLADGTNANGNQPGDFVKMWRHVHDIFTEVGATNVSWVWCPNINTGYPADVQRLAPMSQVYPGDAYVDWVCLDGYNWSTDNGSTWLTFSQIYSRSYNELLALAPSKPMMIGEIGSSEDGGPLGRPDSKAAWLKDMFQQLPTNFPNIKALVWFNWNDNNPKLDWPIESSLVAQGAFADGIRSSYYAENVFGGATFLKR